jgi:cysteine-rich repeat protein
MDAEAAGADFLGVDYVVDTTCGSSSGNPFITVFGTQSEYSDNEDTWTSDLWAKFTSFTGDSTINGDSAGAANYLSVHSDGKVGASLEWSGAATTYHPPALELNKWYHIAWVGEGGGVKTYVNGKQISSEASGGAWKAKDDDFMWFTTPRYRGSYHPKGQFTGMRFIPGVALFTEDFEDALTPVPLGPLGPYDASLCHSDHTCVCRPGYDPATHCKYTLLPGVCGDGQLNPISPPIGSTSVLQLILEDGNAVVGVEPTSTDADANLASVGSGNSAIPDNGEDLYQQWRLRKCVGADCATDGVASAAQWEAGEGAESIEEGDTISWYNVGSGKTQDCNGAYKTGACTVGVFPPPTSNWGGPHKIFKDASTNNSPGSVVRVGDTVYFQRMNGGTWCADCFVQCTSFVQGSFNWGCKGTLDGAKTSFVLKSPQPQPHAHEDCDDRNSDDGDGCTSTCAFATAAFCSGRQQSCPSQRTWADEDGHPVCTSDGSCVCKDPYVGANCSACPVPKIFNQVTGDCEWSNPDGGVAGSNYQGGCCPRGDNGQWCPGGSCDHAECCTQAAGNSGSGLGPNGKGFCQSGLGEVRTFNQADCSGSGMVECRCL